MIRSTFQLVRLGLGFASLQVVVKCVACTVLLVLASFQTAGAATSNVYKDDDGAFIARGYGSNRYRARQDAIRNAFNFAVEQLVVADRRIEGDRIVKDLLISSMFGKAQDLEVLEILYSWRRRSHRDDKSSYW